MIQEEPSRRQRVAEEAAMIVRTARHSHYQHNPIIDPATGTYDLDCSEFVSYVLREVTPEHYARIPKLPNQICPRAYEFSDYLESLTYDKTNGWRRSYEIDEALVYEAAQGWRRVGRLAEARRGDVIAWRFARWSPGADTGHVLLVADKPTPAGAGQIAVRVFDSSRVPHFEDSRDRSGTYHSGVGIGTLLFQVNRAGSPTAVQFAPSDPFHALPIVIGRLEPLAP